MSESTPPSRKDRARRAAKRVLSRWQLAVLLAVVVLVSSGLGFYLHLRSGMPSVEELENFSPQLSTKLLDRNDEVIKEIYTQRRTYTPLSETPAWVTQAFVAVEDHKFYHHWGVRPMALAGAVVKQVFNLNFRFRGASTITQQLARNLYYSSQRTLVRKLREVLTAIEIEKYYSKDEILEMYLTQTYFGAGAYGIGTAAHTYFSKDADELKVEEGALLAAIPKSPTRYNPITNPDNALQRRNVVLGRMRTVGFLTRAEFDSLKQIPLQIDPSTEDAQLGIAPYFTETVRQQLNGIGKTFGFDPYNDGVVVHTTLDATLQACAEEAIASTLPEIQARVADQFRRTELNRVLTKLYPNLAARERQKLAGDKRLVDSLANIHMAVQVAFVALEPGTGHILAMVGGRDFEESKFNRAVQAVRQPGSSFKPIVYAAALDKGTPICTRISNDVVTLKGARGEPWSPQNYDGDYGGSVDMREGLFRSLNVVAVRLITDYTSPREVVRLGHQLGLTTPMDPYVSLALGASGVIPLELCAAYGVFQQRGVWAKPMYITGVDDQMGTIISTYRTERKAVLSEETAFLTETLMRSVVDRGTGAGLRSTYGFRKPAAGKTGTTNDYTDAWFVGYTPHLIACVWVGLDDPSKTLGPGMAGSRAALPVWGKFIVEAYKEMGYRDTDFQVPKGVTMAQVCYESNKLAGPQCLSIHTEYFSRKFALPEPCPLPHGSPYVEPTQRPSLF